MNDVELLKKLDNANSLICSYCEECNGTSKYEECEGCEWCRAILCAGKAETLIEQVSEPMVTAIKVIGGNYMRVGGSWICFKSYYKDIVKIGECDFETVVDFINGIGDEIEYEEWIKQPILHWNGKGWVV